MAKKKNNTNLFLLIGLLLLVGAYFFVMQSDKKKGKSTFRKELFKYNEEEVSKIKITPSRSPNDVVELNKEGEVWKTKLKDGRNIVAEQLAVERVFDQIESIVPQRPVANKKEKWAEYKVDKQGTLIEFFAADEKVVDIIVGKFDIDQNSLRGQQQFGGASQPKFTSYVRVNGEDKTYSVAGFYEDLNSQSVDNFRDKDMFKSKVDAVTQIRFNYPDSSFQLTYNDTWKINGVEVDTVKVKSFLQTLDNLNGAEFSDKPSKSKSDLSLSIRNGNATTTISAFQKDSANFIIQTSDLPLDYFTGKNVFSRIFVPRSNFNRAKPKAASSIKKQAKLNTTNKK